MRVWKQRTDELQTTRKTGSGRRMVTSARDDLHLLRMAVNDRAASSRQLAAGWSTATGVPMTNHRRLRQQWAHEHRAGQADWHQGVFSDESRFNLWDHDGRIRVRRYAGARCFPECVIERYSGLTPEFMLYNPRPYVAKTVRDFCSPQHMQLLPWPAYSPDMLPIEHVWDLVGRCLAHVPRPTASKRNFCFAYK
ncbi:transposable element Tc1 transposase [Trichonephila clavipes]|nr:transposable element Tc1 transposase [Trichonephila clavipes]